MLEDLAARAAKLTEDAAANTRWRRRECVNLIPSEQPVSAFVEALISADPAARYNEHSRIAATGGEVCYYQGTGFIMEKEQELKEALGRLFGCPRVETRVISGQMANDTVYDALKAFHERRLGAGPRLLSRVLVHDLIRGGHLSAQPMGALKNYLANDPTTGRPAAEHFPARHDNPYRIDVEVTKELILRTRPELVVFGRSMIIETEPVREIASFLHGEFGTDNPERPLIMYDGAHVLGLLGPAFQDPLAEGADIVTGSTHKTFFGPQRGLVLGNIAPGSAFDPLWQLIERRTFPGHVSNHHLGTMLGLLGATLEMLRFRGDYPAQVVANARAFASALAAEGLQIEGDPSIGHTRTHQVLLRTARARGRALAERLELCNIITNAQALPDDAGFAEASGIRMGTQEMTRHGMKEADFGEFAGLLARITRDDGGRGADAWREEVIQFRSRFADMQYCL